MADVSRTRRRRRLRRLTRRDKLVLVLLVGVPTIVHIGLIWVPTIASVLLSFTGWNGFDDISDIDWIGLQNYRDIVQIYPPFWPALRHNVIWLVFFLLVPTTLGLLLAYLLDKNLKGTRIYQSAIFVPVVLSLALVGFIWELVYQDQSGLLNNLIRIVEPGFHRQWLSQSGNLYAVLVAASWRHVGYVMILFLAGLKSVDPSQREAAALDGAGEWQTFRHVVFPALAPINVVVLVITIIESLRAFDIVYVINGGRNGLELLSVLVTDNVIGEASRVGYGSALAVILLVISLGVIMPYLYTVFRKDVRG
ncbi:MAG: carbohydrate ABC transporter permease [Nocardioidaceae bacterium]